MKKMFVLLGLAFAAGCCTIEDADVGHLTIEAPTDKYIAVIEEYATKLNNDFGYETTYGKGSVSGGRATVVLKFKRPSRADTYRNLYFKQYHENKKLRKQLEALTNSVDTVTNK